MSLEPGREVERYVVQGLLGEGGMAEVYRVRHGTLGTHHALKVLTISSRTVRERLIQEGRLQATLRHPNIVAVTDVITVDGAPGLLMEFIEGPALDTWLLSYRPTLEEALTVFSGILAGVRSAHNKGLIHRDLKPANVLMHIEDGSVVPKVADFGLAKAVEGDGGMAKTKSGTTMGTPAYMPPEQIRDASKVDKRADIFALGCILYELVCGRQTHQGDDIITLFNAIADAKYPAPRELVPDLPPHVEDAILGALELDAEQRIADCKAFQELLERPEGSDVRIPMPTILPEDGPGAEAARSMVSMASFEDVPASTSTAPSSQTWIGDPASDGGVPSKHAEVPSMLDSKDTFGREQTSEFQTELTQLRRQNMMMMGGTMFGLTAVVIVALTGIAIAIVIALGSGDETTVAEVETPVETPVDKTPPDPKKPEVKEPEVKEPEVKEPEVKEPEVKEPVKKTPTKKTPVKKTPVKKVVEVEPEIKKPPPPPPPPVETVPDPPAPAGGSIVLSGDARMVMLEGKAGKFKTNEFVPPGRYDIKAWFGAPQPVSAGSVTISDGDVVKLKCISLMAQCVKQ